MYVGQWALKPTASAEDLVTEVIAKIPLNIRVH